MEKQIKNSMSAVLYIEVLNFVHTEVCKNLLKIDRNNIICKTILFKI